MEHRIEINDWAKQYLIDLFKSKGYDVLSDENCREVYETQLQDWKRLMVKTGLNADQMLADEVAFEFRCKTLKGGAGRLFEAFAEFVISRPKPFREKEERDYTNATDCDMCKNRGYMYASMVDRDGEIKERLFRCECITSMKYAALPPASADVRRQVLTERREEAYRLEQWSRSVDIDTTTQETFMTGWKAWLKKQGSMGAVFTRVDDAVKEPKPSKKRPSVSVMEDEEFLSSL